MEATAAATRHLLQFGLFMAGFYALLFVLLQSFFLIWIGVLLAELRRRSGSWPVAWIGHAAYNASFLYVFALIR